MLYSITATLSIFVASKPTRDIIPLAVLGGIYQALSQASATKLGDDRSLLQVLGLVCLVLGPVGGVIGVYVAAFLVRLVARFLGGRAPPDETRAAVAWSNVPVIATLPLWGLQIIVFGNENFTTETPWINSMAGNTLLFFSILGVSLYWIARIWGIVIVVGAIAEVNRFSVLRAITALMLPLVLFFFVLRP